MNAPFNPPKSIPIRMSIVRRYVAGATIREVRDAEFRSTGKPISYETVRQHLIRAGVKLRKNRRLGGPMGVQLVQDLQTQFPAGASVPELVEWFGADRKNVLNVLSKLLKAGHLAVVLRDDP